MGERLDREVGETAYSGIELGEFGLDCEARVVSALGLNAAEQNNEGFDGIDSEGRRHQIKCRRLSSAGALYRRIEQVGDISTFDILDVCILEPDGSILKDAWSIDRAVLERYVEFTTDRRRWWVELSDLVADTAVVNIRERLLASPSFRYGPETAPFRLDPREPWERGRQNFGKVKVSKSMATDLLVMCYLEIGRLMSFRESLPNPSTESEAILNRMRRIQKVRDRIRGTMNEQGWPIPASEALAELSKVPEEIET